MAPPVKDDTKKKRFGRLLKCPFCPERMYSNYFKCHVFGYRDLPAICAASRQKYPNGMTLEQYQIFQARSSEQAAFERLPESARQKAADILSQNAPTESWELDMSSKPASAPAPLPAPSVPIVERKRERHHESVARSPGYYGSESLSDKARCSLCGETVIALTTACLPCCFRQRMCLWCLVKESRVNGKMLKCQSCKLSFVPPAEQEGVENSTTGAVVLGA